jgi:predicted acyl esterase
VPKEYSDVELDFAVFLIEWLSQQRFCNGRVGMFGKSWSAFNAIMLGIVEVWF